MARKTDRLRRARRYADKGQIDKVVIEVAKALHETGDESVLERGRSLMQRALRRVLQTHFTQPLNAEIIEIEHRNKAKRNESV